MTEARLASRIGAAFARSREEGRLALIPYMIPGYPSLAESEDVFDALVAGGADIIEIGIPFSDPLADGATIQRASMQALEQGVTPSDCLDFATRMRHRHADVGIVFMTYLNLVLRFGYEGFAARAEAAGADGVILIDLPPEEAAEAEAALRRHGLDLVCLVAPTSSPERVEMIARRASGFIYCVSVAGITGARAELPPGLADFVAGVRRCTNLPLAVGFGLSRREHIVSLTGIADGAAVGSALVTAIAEARPEERATAVREYLEVLSGRRRSLS